MGSVPELARPLTPISADQCMHTTFQPWLCSDMGSEIHITACFCINVLQEIIAGVHPSRMLREAQAALPEMKTVPDTPSKVLSLYPNS